MRKNINKIIAFAIGISVMSGSVVPALAADSTQQTTTSTSTATNSQIVNGKQLLTLDEAIKEAISISEVLQLDTSKITYQDKTNDINEDLDDYKDVSGDDEDFNDDTREANANKARQQRDFDQDALIQKVTKAYNNIVTSQMKIDKAEKELQIKNKTLNDAKLKSSLGMVTSSDLKSTELEIENLQITQKTSENTLKDAEYSFKVLTGKDVTQYTLEQDIPYETLKIDGSIDTYLDKVIDNYLKYREQILKLKKDYYYDSDNKVTDRDVSDAKEKTDGAVEPTLQEGETIVDYMKRYNEYQAAKSAYANAISARLTYLGNRLSVDQEQTSIDEDKKNFKNQLRTLYTNLITAQDNINYIKQNIELSNKNLSDAKLKYDLGMITESTYNTQVLSSEDLNIQLRSQIDAYNTLKQEIQKPWIAFSGAQ
ncbi:TolC family protein [Clostridium beijerinckii]|uniref:TolC family protein n=1 Tax=Clostridium beijerinckii TaxID=1520 RepID=UPI00156D5B4F|nr:TolC family protein [Clostridium beijerinckii]NRT71655.1 outer membrane protein TolC [Clostridium beijerinckii]